MIVDEYRKKVAYALGQIAATPGAGKAGEDAMRVLVESLAQPQNRSRREGGAARRRQGGGAGARRAPVGPDQGRSDHGGGDARRARRRERATAALTAELERGRVAMPLVLEALGATHDPNALVPVLGAVSNKDAAIRIAAMEALRPLLGSDARAGDVLIERLGDEDLEVRDPRRRVPRQPPGRRRGAQADRARRAR